MTSVPTADQTPFQFIACPPSVLGEPELNDFMALVRAGNEVDAEVLDASVRKARSLALARRGECLVGVAALKDPRTSYRDRVARKAGVSIKASQFPFELGYLFVMPSSRFQGLALRLCREALLASGGQGVFATTRTDNEGLHTILPRLAFAKAGKPYASDRGDHELQLFLLQPAKGPS